MAKTRAKTLKQGRDKAAAMANAGAHFALDRNGAHRQRIVPNKVREQRRRACRNYR